MIYFAQRETAPIIKYQQSTSQQYGLLNCFTIKMCLRTLFLQIKQLIKLIELMWLGLMQKL